MIYCHNNACKLGIKVGDIGVEIEHNPLLSPPSISMNCYPIENEDVATLIEKGVCCFLLTDDDILVFMI